jgi:carboxymethylenebutenolidase
MVDDPVRRAATALFDRFTHEGMDRRAFMAELTRLAGGAAAASAMLAGLAPSAHAAPLVPADHPELDAREEVLAAGQDRLRVYRVRRKDPPRGRRAGRRAPPAVLVIHENRGLNAHIRDVARRLALAGYDAVAPDFLSFDGGATPADEDAARTAIGALDLGRATAAGAALIRSLRAPGTVRGARAKPVGVVGFCWGGAMVHRLALAAGADLAGGVSFYGPAPERAEAARLRSPLLVILAGRDERVNRTAFPYVAAGEAAGRQVRAITYPDVDHAFHNDTSAARYNRAAAEQAWRETLSFFARHLR